MTTINPGLSHTSRLKVEQRHTAQAMGSGDLPVLATPAMTALMENAAMQAVAPCLDTAHTTVGGYIEALHLKPTRVGSEVTARATLTKVEGKRLQFDVEAYAGDVLIGRGTHVRYVVDRDRFMSF